MGWLSITALHIEGFCVRSAEVLCIEGVMC
jgi:hypothetical protein